jgi:thiol:disulfide interchange protein
MNRFAILVLVLAIAVSACAEDKKDTKEKGGSEPTKLVGFHKLNYDKALVKAKDSKKIVMIDFTAEWCGWCKKLDKDTFTDEKVQKLLTDKAVAIKVDADENKDLVKKYKVNGLPCLVFLNGEGKEVGRVEGYLDAKDFYAEASKYLK